MRKPPIIVGYTPGRTYRRSRLREKSSLPSPMRWGAELYQFVAPVLNIIASDVFIQNGNAQVNFDAIGTLRVTGSSLIVGSK